MIQLPEAFWAGISEKAEPVPPERPRTRPWNFTLAAVEVGGQRHRLAGAHLRQLHFLEVGVDVGLGRSGTIGHQRRADGDLLADLDLLLGDHAVDRRADHGAVERQLGGVEPGAGGGDLGVLLER